MAYKLNVTEHADELLDHLVDYLVNNLKNEQAAKHLLDSFLIDEKSPVHSQYPLLYQKQ